MYVPSQSDLFCQNNGAQDCSYNHAQGVESSNKDWTSLFHHYPLHIVCNPRAHYSLHANKYCNVYLWHKSEFLFLWTYRIKCSEESHVPTYGPRFSIPAFHY